MTNSPFFQSNKFQTFQKKLQQHVPSTAQIHHQINPHEILNTGTIQPLYDIKQAGFSNMTGLNTNALKESSNPNNASIMTKQTPITTQNTTYTNVSQTQLYRDWRIDSAALQMTRNALNILQMEKKELKATLMEQLLYEYEKEEGETDQQIIKELTNQR